MRGERHEQPTCVQQLKLSMRPVVRVRRLRLTAWAAQPVPRALFELGLTAPTAIASYIRYCIPALLPIEAIHVEELEY
jgi:hypothetical protein